MSKPLTDTEQAADEQAEVAESNTTGNEVEPESNDDMNIFGFAKKKKHEDPPAE